MTWSRLSPWLGGVLLAAALLWAGARTLFRPARGEAADGVPTIRFAHFQLEAGVRGAFDQVARAFEAASAARGRPVRVEQVAIPESVYPSWYRTQLVGGTAPEIMVLGRDASLTARYFTPLGEFVRQPNAFNEGTPLEGRTWASTFLDGMAVGGFVDGLLEHYSVPYTVITVRVFYNRSLMAEILAAPEGEGLRPMFAREPPGPADYREFVAVCEAASAFARARRRILSPLGGSSFNASVLLERFISLPTQRLMLGLDPRGTWSADDPGFYQLTAMLAGRWSFVGSEARAGLALARQLAQFMPPGFTQLRREDSTFQFLQGRALMLTSLAIDGPGLVAQAKGFFDIGAFAIPMPEADDPEFGQLVLGRVSEADNNPYGLLGIVQFHSEERKALALDFLRFLSSQPGNQLFSDASGWLPCIEGVTPRPNLRPFMPRLDGYPGGVDFRRGDADLQRALRLHAQRLYDPEGSVDRYLAATGDLYLGAIRSFLDRQERLQRQQRNLNDVLMEAWRARAAAATGEVARELYRSKAGRLLDAQQAQETARLHRQLLLSGDAP